MRDREERRFASHGADSDCESESRFGLNLRFCSIKAGTPSEKSTERERKQQRQIEIEDVSEKLRLEKKM